MITKKPYLKIPNTKVDAMAKPWKPYEYIHRGRRRSHLLGKKSVHESQARKARIHQRLMPVRTPKRPVSVVFVAWTAEAVVSTSEFLTEKWQSKKSDHLSKPVFSVYTMIIPIGSKLRKNSNKCFPTRILSSHLPTPHWVCPAPSKTPCEKMPS